MSSLNLRMTFFLCYYDLYKCLLALRQAQGPKTVVELVETYSYRRRWLSLSKPHHLAINIIEVIPFQDTQAHFQTPCASPSIPAFR